MKLFILVIFILLQTLSASIQTNNSSIVTNYLLSNSLDKPSLVDDELNATSDNNMTIAIKGEVGTTLYVNGIAFTVIGSSGEVMITLSLEDGDNIFNLFLENTDGSRSDTLTFTIIKIISVPTLQKLVLNQSSINLIKKKKIVRNYYFGERYSIKVMGVYSDGHSEELRDHVTWTRQRDGKNIEHLSDYLQNIGTSKLKASIGDIQSEILDVNVQKEGEGRLLLYRPTNNKGVYAYRGTRVDMKLRLKTKVNVTLKLTLDEEDKVRFRDGGLSKEITFKPSTYSYPSSRVVIVDKDINNTLPYTITTEVFESDDTRYDGQDPSDIEITPRPIVLAPPPIEQRRGAIRGVSIQFRVISESVNLEYKLINPPEGMKILGSSDLGEFIYEIQGVDIEWNVPMDMEEREHEITVEATDREGNKGEVTFSIKVAKTNAIETEIINNELIVTEKNSMLYGMKMKGHSGENISELEIRRVDYLDLWVEEKVNKLEKYASFIIYNKAPKVDFDFPEIFDIYKYVPGKLFYENSAWININRGYREDNDGYFTIILYREHDNGGTQLYLINRIK